MMTLNEIQSALNERGMAARLARVSGVSAMTLSRIANGTVKNPGIETVGKIEQALTQIRAEDERERATA